MVVCRAGSEFAVSMCQGQFCLRGKEAFVVSCDISNSKTVLCLSF